VFSHPFYVLFFPIRNLEQCSENDSWLPPLGEDGAARLRREIQDSEASLQRRIEEVLYAAGKEGVLTGYGRDGAVAVQTTTSGTATLICRYP